MVVSSELLAQAKQVKSGRPMTEPTAVWLEALRSATEEFNLAPDDWIDVKRLPPAITTLSELVNYLKGVRTELEKPSQETMESGRLRLYKLFVCCIHGLHGYLTAAPEFDVDTSAFASSAMVYAKGHPPPGLSNNGQKLWGKTFESESGRPYSCMCALIAFLQSDGADSRPPPSKPPPPDDDDEEEDTGGYDRYSDAQPDK